MCYDSASVQPLRGLIAEQTRQSILKIVQAVARRGDSSGNPGPESDTSTRNEPFSVTSDPNLTTRAIRRDGILHAVLHQRLDRQRRDARCISTPQHVDLIAQNRSPKRARSISR